MPFWLSMHVGYRCRHTGACCTSDWPIPIEAHRVGPVRDAVLDGRIPVAVGPEGWPAGAPHGVGGLLARDTHGRCIFHQHDRCGIQGALGHAALPAACQHFPRVCLTDPRGVFVTLSQYCPTAASMLFDETTVSIVDGPPVLPGSETPEGLDAREAWPPLLTERLLMDHESYGLWEAHMIHVLAGDTSNAQIPEAALASLRADAERLGAWRPSHGRLVDAVRTQMPQMPQMAQMAQMAEMERQQMRTGAATLALFRVVRGAVLPPLTWPEAPGAFEREWASRTEPAWPVWSSVVRRYLAAHAFGSWVAYQGRGILAIVRSLEAALAVLQVELVRLCQTRDATLDRTTLRDAIRQADLLLRHHADRQALADQLSID